MNIPLFERDGFIICFEAEEEEASARRHFIKECKWTEEQYLEIEDFDWFSAKVSAWRDGEELGAAYLGACCYKAAKEFYTTYNCDGGYFPQMADEAIEEAKATLATLRNKTPQETP